MLISNYTWSGTDPHAVAISNPADIPADYTGARDSRLAPSSGLLARYHAREIDLTTYAEEYIAELTANGITPQGIEADYPPETIFICYDYEDGVEGGGDADGATPLFCHRYILATWLQDNGIYVGAA